MRLYVYCSSCNNKIYIASDAKIRSQLPPSFSLRCPICDEVNLYTSHDVYAERSDINSAGTAMIGGILGVVAGAIGVIAGTIFGGLLGENWKVLESAAVSRFNQS
jgi:hypothetical protein